MIMFLFVWKMIGKWCDSPGVVGVGLIMKTFQVLEFTKSPTGLSLGNQVDGWPGARHLEKSANKSCASSTQMSCICSTQKDKFNLNSSFFCIQLLHAEFLCYWLFGNEMYEWHQLHVVDILLWIQLAIEFSVREICILVIVYMNLSAWSLPGGQKVGALSPSIVRISFAAYGIGTSAHICSELPEIQNLDIIENHATW